jgi:hypothetical protein
MPALLRSMRLLTAISIGALILPARGEIHPAPARAAQHCCARQPANHGHCGNEPANSQERQCCSNCTTGVSLINALPVVYVFSRSGGENLVTASIDEMTRSTRPPVPPPRA